MINKSFLLCLLLIWMANPINAQLEPGMPNEQGKCYAKCLMADQYITEYKLLPRYTGPPVDTLTNSGVIALHFIPQAGGTKWEKKRADKNCISKNPEDCLVWCLINLPDIKNIEYFVVDTLLNTSYQWQEFPIKKLVRRGGFTEWKEILCESDCTPKMLKKLQKALLTKGYYDGEVDGDMNTALKQALLAYQKTEGLDFGALTKETLKALGMIRK